LIGVKWYFSDNFIRKSAKGSMKAIERKRVDPGLVSARLHNSFGGIYHTISGLQNPRAACKGGGKGQSYGTHYDTILGSEYR